MSAVQAAKDLAATATSSITNLVNGAKLPQNQTILISGASGFVAAHVLNSFLQRGYNVRGTVRSEATAEKVKQTHSKYLKQLSFAIVKDVAVPGAFDEAVKDVDGVVHTASPFVMDVEDNERDLLNPAVKGTTEILKAIKKNNPIVKRVVITSSFAALVDLSQGTRVGYTYTEADWNPVTWDEAKTGPGGVAYCASKVFAEKAAYEFVEKEKPNFTISTICPPMIYGPIAQSVTDLSRLNTSAADIYRLFNGTTKEVPATEFPAYADVRDVGEAHVRAYESVGAAQQRYFITGGNMSYREICEIIREVPEVKEKVPQAAPGSKEPEVYKVSNAKATKELGMTFIPLRQCIIDTVHSLLKVEQSVGK
ncbi:NAD(P)-binding protein [Mytilinidion resinicola]|uniref:NAD(P)-binding protein n=1 Tax=Mytilinidion resinicola TaxID=574789 RepID=A0A6A6YC48_9PEZI|nr:NAD(P)-binding protein [Mytilinidion resinicola]KAF2805675.1 NAD(P)-binding protein [Mytilinidion resinicola]